MQMEELRQDKLTLGLLCK